MFIPALIRFFTVSPEERMLRDLKRRIRQADAEAAELKRRLDQEHATIDQLILSGLEGIM